MKIVDYLNRFKDFPMLHCANCGVNVKVKSFEEYSFIISSSGLSFSTYCKDCLRSNPTLASQYESLRDINEALKHALLNEDFSLFYNRATNGYLCGCCGQSIDESKRTFYKTSLPVSNNNVIMGQDTVLCAQCEIPFSTILHSLPIDNCVECKRIVRVTKSEFQIRKVLGHLGKYLCFNCAISRSVDFKGERFEYLNCPNCHAQVVDDMLLKLDKLVCPKCYTALDMKLLSAPKKVPIHVKSDGKPLTVNVYFRNSTEQDTNILCVDLIDTLKTLIEYRWSNTSDFSDVLLYILNDLYNNWDEYINYKGHRLVKTVVV